MSWMISKGLSFLFLAGINFEFFRAMMIMNIFIKVNLKDIERMAVSK